MIVRERSPFQQLAPVSLAELQDGAAFLTRKDRKYLVPVEVLASFVETCDPRTRVLDIDGQRTFGYQSAYFDDDHLSAYHAARCRRSHRYKVRTRQYLDSGSSFLEVKVRDGRGRTVKHRRTHDTDCPLTLVEPEREWLTSFPFLSFRLSTLNVRLQTRYERTTLLLPEAAGRVTVDRHLVFARPAGDEFEVSNLVVIETKGAGRPTPADRVLWRLGYRPVSLSKYAVGMCVLNPELPANRWHRLRRYLIGQDARGRAA